MGPYGVLVSLPSRIAIRRPEIQNWNGMAEGTRRERTPAPGGTAISRGIKNPTLVVEKWGWRAAPFAGPAYAPAGPVPPKSSQVCQTG